jgi:hypothetical protein
LFDLGIAVEKFSFLFVFKIVSDWDAFGIPDPYCANSIGRYVPVRLRTGFRSKGQRVNNLPIATFSVKKRQFS